MAIESIPFFKWTFEQLIKLLDMDFKVQKDRFENIFDPTFMNMSAIHKDYMDMFNKILDILPVHLSNDKNEAFITIFDDKYNPIKHQEKTDIGSSLYKKNIKISKNIIDSDRKANDWLRIQARTLSQKIILKGKNKFEKRFCWSIINYFINHNFYSSLIEEDEFLKNLAIQGSDRMTKTPSYLISHKLDYEENAQIIREEIITKKLILTDNFTNILSKYLDLKLRVYT